MAHQQRQMVSVHVAIHQGIHRAVALEDGNTITEQAHDLARTRRPPLDNQQDADAGKLPIVTMRLHLDVGSIRVDDLASGGTSRLYRHCKSIHARWISSTR